MSRITRRKFLEITESTMIKGAAGLGIATFVLKKADTLLGMSKDLPAARSDDTEKVIPSYCDVCFMTCGINVTVKNSRAVKIEGNPEHPLSRGRLCPRGTAGLGQLYDPDRLKEPLLRTTFLGRQRFRAVSWDDALNFTAEKMLDIKRKYGPQALALLKHGKGASPFVRMWHAMGSATEGHPSYGQCRGARDVGWQLTFGIDAGGIERIALDKAKVVAFIGSHLGENMHNTTVQDFARGLNAGAKNIVVDPRFSKTAGKAKYWLPIKPGTDLALLLAWIHVLIYENRYDKNFIGKYAYGFDQLREHVRTMTPEWAAPHTGLSSSDIRETARELGNAIPESLVFPGRRYAWYGDDTQRARAVAILNALLGAWGNESGVFLGSSYPLPAYDEYPPFAAHGKQAFDYKKKFPLATSTPMQSILEASIPGKYDPAVRDALIKGWVVYGTNLPYSVPNPSLIREAARHLELLVVIETMPAEMTGYADVVLPDTTYLERYDGLNNPSWREPFLSIRQPVVKPLHNSKPSWWIAKELAARLGLGEYFPYTDYREVIENQLNKLGSSIDDINKKGGVLKKKYRKPAMKFKTPTGRVELYSTKLAGAGFNPLPSYHEPTIAPFGYFRLITGRASQHTFTRTTNNPMLNELYHENMLWVNTEIALQYGLRDRQYVVLENQSGARSRHIRVNVTERIRNDCVYMVHGFGRDDRRLGKAFSMGADDNALLTDYGVDPIMGGTGSNINFVKFVL